MRRNAFLMATALALTALGTPGCRHALQPSSSPAASTPPVDQDETTMSSAQHNDISGRDYQRACDAELRRARDLFENLESDGERLGDGAVLAALNDLSMTIDSGMNRASLLRNVHPDAAVRTAADRCEQEFSKIVTALGLSRRVYDAVVAINKAPLDALSRRYVDHVLRDFRRAGVDKNEASREKIRLLQEELVKVGQAFDKNIRQDVRSLVLGSPDELSGLPADYIAAHGPGGDGKITLTTDYPDIIPFMSYAKSDARRLEFYRLFRQRGYPANAAVLDALLRKRWELARLLGYESWAAYITEDKMIKSAEAAQGFIDNISRLAAARAQADYDEMLAALQRTTPAATQVGDWQKAFLEEEIKREKYSFDSQAVRQYFSYERVRDGIFALTSRLFGVQFRAADAATWHASVEAYDLMKEGKFIGRFYLDMHPRQDKYKHAAAFPIRSGVKARRIPEAALVCNFPGGGEGGSLMEHRQVETFFHEFGHLLHHLFAGNQPWVRFSGIATEWDFVEAPSQMLEEWAWDAETLRGFAINDRGEPIPTQLVAAMRRARDFGKGLFVKHQMFYAALSLSYYNRNPADIDTTLLAKQVQAQYSPFRYVDDTYFQYSFGHLDGYSAIYYTYMWSLVIAKDLFSVFQEQGLLQPATAERYRRSVLEPGGSADAADLVRSFLGRDYSFDAFSRWLNEGGERRPHS